MPIFSQLMCACPLGLRNEPLETLPPLGLCLGSLITHSLWHALLCCFVLILESEEIHFIVSPLKMLKVTLETHMHYIVKLHR